MPILTLESDTSYVFIAYWPTEHLVEDWDCNFLKSSASIVQSACIRRDALLSERAELRIMRSVRHEMRTPLHAILGQSTQMQQSLAVDNGNIDLSEIVWLSKSIQHAGEDLRKLLDNLLDCGEAISLTTPIKGRDSADITQLIEESCAEELLASADRSLLDHLSNGRKAEAIPLPLVLIHAQREVEQAVFNSINAERVSKMMSQFISNAIRFGKNNDSERSLVDISIKLLPKDSIEVIIKDNGIGMSASFLQHFAQPFQKASTFRQGAGLGCVLARSLLNQLRGTMKVSSTEGKGTSVTLTFPSDQRQPTALFDAPQDLSSTSMPSCGILCDFNSSKDASILDMLRRHFTPRFNLVEEEGGKTDGCKLFLFDPSSQDSRDKLQNLCKEASARQNLVIFSTSLKYDLDSAIEAIDMNPYIHCCINPIGPSALNALDCFLSNADGANAKTRPRRRSSNTANATSGYIEHKVSPLKSPSRYSKDKSSAPDSPTTTMKAMKALTLVHDPDANSTAATKESPPEAVPRSRRPSRLEKVQEGIYDPAGFSVLIVEDNPVNMRLLEACVKKTKCYYKTAVDGREAIERYKEMPPGPTVVLLDISLPIMDGFEACKAMRAFDREDSSGRVLSRIVAITALSSQQDVENGLTIGMNEWRVKPCNLPKLTADLLRWKKEWQDSNSESPLDISQT
jgi:signal transduction histidine kinase/CheY-like chemotaxis protein